VTAALSALWKPSVGDAYTSCSTYTTESTSKSY